MDICIAKKNKMKTSKGKILRSHKQKKKLITPKQTKAIRGLLGLKGKMLKSLMEEKKIEREL
jgi:hypothetical protein